MSTRENWLDRAEVDPNAERHPVVRLVPGQLVESGRFESYGTIFQHYSRRNMARGDVGHAGYVAAGGDAAWWVVVNGQRVASGQAENQSKALQDGEEALVAFWAARATHWSYLSA